MLTIWLKNKAHLLTYTEYIFHSFIYYVFSFQTRKIQRIKVPTKNLHSEKKSVEVESFSFRCFEKKKRRNEKQKQKMEKKKFHSFDIKQPIIIHTNYPLSDCFE